MLKSPRNSLTAAVIRLALDKTSTDCVYGLYLTANGRWIVSANCLISDKFTNIF